MLFAISSPLLMVWFLFIFSLAPIFVSGKPKLDIEFPLGDSYDYNNKEYQEYCCDQFDRFDGHSTQRRVLEPECENKGAMAACFCGLLQDYESTNNWMTMTSSSSLSLRSSPAGQQQQQQQQQQQSFSSSEGTPCIRGSAGGYPCSNTALLSFIPNSHFNQNQNAVEDANDIWGWTFYGNNNGDGVREFALIGLRDGVGFVDITDPVNPIILGRLNSSVGNSMWRDIKVHNDYAFVVSESTGHGMQVFNLRRLLTASTTAFTNFNADTTFDSFRAHNIVINEDTGYAYIVGGRMGNRYLCDGGLYMVDIRIPLAPQIVGCATFDYTHDAHCVVYHGPDTVYVGKEICFLCNTNHVGIVDVSDKQNPIILSEKSYRDSQYTHQGWLSPDHSYFVFGDELDETRERIDTTILVMNVADLDNPMSPGRYVATGRKAIDHNLYIRRFGGSATNGASSSSTTDIIYLANYRAGMRVLKVNDYGSVGPSDSSNGFEEIGYFDTYPSNDDASYNGAWSVYPYFDSGTVVISSIGEGLFVVRPDLSGHIPTPNPTANPSNVPTVSPEPSTDPTMAPSLSLAPSVSPSSTPSTSPSSRPSLLPTTIPSSEPSVEPSTMPSPIPSLEPSDFPSAPPSVSPSCEPSSIPSVAPSNEAADTFNLLSVPAPPTATRTSSSANKHFTQPGALLLSLLLIVFLLVATLLF